MAPGIRKVKITPHWEGSGISVTVGTSSWGYDDPVHGIGRIIDSDTITTSGTASSFLRIATNATKLHISVTDGSQTTVYTRKYLVREADAANSDNYLNSMGVSPNPNARESAPSRGVISQGQFPGGAQQAGGSVTLTPPFARMVQEYSSTAPFTPTGGEPQAGGSITLTPPFDSDVQEYSATVPYAVSSVIISPVPSHSKATATVNGKSPSTPVSLEVGENVITVVVTAESGVERTYTLTITRGAENRPPAVASAIADATIVNESGIKQVSLSGVFSDPDDDDLTITASSSEEAVATAPVASDYSSLTVNAQARGTATITVTADDGKGGTVSDSFTVTVKAAPVVTSALADVADLEEDSTQDVSLSGVFRDADGDALTISAASSDDAKATVSVAADQSKLTVAGVAEGTASITVTAQDSDGNRVSDTFDVAVTEAPQLQQANRAPTVASAIGDATIVNESGTREVSMSGVFSDADNDALTITAASSDDATATASVAPDQSRLTVTARSKGAATITVTADDGNGGTVEDTFAVTVKAAPVVASGQADVSGLEAGATQVVSLAGAFSDADGDTLTVTASSSDDARATVTVSFDGSTLTVAGIAEGKATITVTAQDSDGNRVSDAFEVSVMEIPGPVVKLQLSATSDSVTVSWQAPESGGTPQRYIVHLKKEHGKKGSGNTKRPKAKKTSVTFKDLEAGQTYKVWVRGQNQAGKSERVHAEITLP